MTLRPPAGDAFPADPRDASYGATANASRAATSDASRRALDDASPSGPGDASPLEPRRLVCEWCGNPIPAGKRRDATTCRTACRQARHRFRVGSASATASDRPMRFAYADPPYPGLARRYYGCEEVDHGELIRRLVLEYPDGWALSTSAEALQFVLALCPHGVRICAWVRGSRGARSRSALNAWEPVLVYGGRREREAVVQVLRDVLIWGGRQRSHPGALVGMKPAAFCEWVFRLLGARRGDSLDDLFPGSGAVSRAWTLYTGEPRQGLPSRLAGATLRIPT